MCWLCWCWRFGIRLLRLEGVLMIDVCINGSWGSGWACEVGCDVEVVVFDALIDLLLVLFEPVVHALDLLVFASAFTQHKVGQGQELNSPVQHAGLVFGFTLLFVTLQDGPVGVLPCCMCVGRQFGEEVSVFGNFFGGRQAIRQGRCCWARRVGRIWWRIAWRSAVRIASAASSALSRPSVFATSTPLWLRAGRFGCC